MPRKNNILEPAGMKAGHFFTLTPADLIRLPPTSEIFRLPGRVPVSYDPSKLMFVEDKDNMPIAAFLPPGYTVTYNTAFVEKGAPKRLPLFSYAACAVHGKDIYAAAVRVDRSLCHDSRFMDMRLIRQNIFGFLKLFPSNRLIRHLKCCALKYNCPNAKNFFLARYEAPLPVSGWCNAECAGCISYQRDKKCPITQARIKFTPRPEELIEVALLHIERARRPIVSFGQGCEGEPLLCAGVIEKTIKFIRKNTYKGVINMNTNASSPYAIARLFDAGLDSVRVSLNSARKKYYTAYYKPRGYSFEDVCQSIDTAKSAGGFVSINYLTMPGFTDSIDEFYAFRKFLRRHRIDMVQWRNLNYDPLRYFKDLKVNVDVSKMLGVKEIITMLKKEFPDLKMGYFNKPR